MLMKMRALAVLLVLRSAVAAGACTICDSPTSQQVRSGILDGRFALTWLEVIAPFPLLALLLGAIHWSLRD